MRLSRTQVGWLLLAASLIITGEEVNDTLFLQSRWYKDLKDLLKMVLEDDIYREQLLIKSMPEGIL